MRLLFDIFWAQILGMAQETSQITQEIDWKAKLAENNHVQKKLAELACFEEGR